MVGLYGIVKAGAAYLPLDLDYPRESARALVQFAIGEGLVLEFDRCRVGTDGGPAGEDPGQG
ncbi:hypothetical protein, partial [Nocardia cyriacigeorgica]|uniref:hypothetical protein n=1 Tax=Nocardia cyriacigeorgica TaxID=135487 RepID=UPI0034D95EC7